MEINVEDYLTEEQMKEIAVKIYTEKMNESIDIIIKNRTGGKLVDDIFSKIVESYVSNMEDRYNDEILELCRSEIRRDRSTSANYDDTLRTSIRLKLQTVAKSILDDNIDSIKSSIYDSIQENLDEKLAFAFIELLIKNLKLNDIVKNVIQDKYKNQKEIKDNE